jgi:hypothetical protein
MQQGAWLAPADGEAPAGGRPAAAAWQLDLGYRAW